MEIPELQTARLKLRAFREADLDGWAAIRADPETGRFIGGTQDRAGAWRSMAVYLGHWQLRGYGLWAVESRSTGDLLGRVGLWRPEGWPGTEVGWTLARSAWGRGYATEAARASCAWAHDALAMPRIISVIDPSNARSIAVAERLGLAHADDWDAPSGSMRIYAADLPLPSPPPG